MDIDHYAVLGVAPTATDDDVVAAFRDAAQVNHPDHGGTAEAMAQLNEAWKVLGDRNDRAAYDVRQRWQQARTRNAIEAAAEALPPTARTTAVLLPLGRYAGMPIEAVAEVDRDYLRWLAEMPTAHGIRPRIEAALKPRRA